MAKICVFCGSRTGHNPEFVRTATELGILLAKRQHTMVYGGGSTGIMGALADAMLPLGGQIIGVIPTHLARPELMHSQVADMRITADMHERKALMHELTDAYIALPGGFGTMEELFEAVTWAQLELHSRPIAILNTCGLYDGLIQLIHTMHREGFLSERCIQLLTVCSSIDELASWLEKSATPST